VSAPAFDLQSHSLHSDGELTAAQVVENAAEAGVKLLALSDHDTVDGVDEALASGALHGVRVVPATEISAVDGPYEDLHVLGYGIDHRSRLLGERLLDARLCGVLHHLRSRKLPVRVDGVRLQVERRGAHGGQHISA